MRRPQTGGAVVVVAVALCLFLAGGQGAPASPVQARRAADDCAGLSTTTPDWQLTNAVSSDWPGGGSGRVQFFARHVPTKQLGSCNVNYSLNEDGEIIDYDPAATHRCVNFGATPLNTTVQLDMETLQLTLRSTWTCEGDEGDEATSYTATGETSLDRDMSPGACLVEPTQIGDSTTCPIANVEVEGTLAEEL